MPFFAVLATIAAIAPDFTAVGGTKLQSVIGALLTLALIAAVAVLISSAISWGVGNYQLATKGNTGVILALIGAALTGSAVAYLNWLVRIGGRM